MFIKQETEPSHFHNNFEEKKINKLNKENSLQDLLNLQTPRNSKEEMLLQSLDRNRNSCTFYSTNCISNSEKSLFNLNERESLSFNLENNFNTNFFNNNVNNYSPNFTNSDNNNNYIYNSNCNKNNNNEDKFNLTSSAKNSKSDLNLVANLNNVFFSLEKEPDKEADEENSNANMLNNSGFTMNCRVTEEREAKSGFIKFDIPFEDLKENNFEAVFDNINEKNNEININNNYNLESKKQMGKLKENKKRDKDDELKKQGERRQRRKVSNKKIDAIRKKLESGIN